MYVQYVHFLLYMATALKAGQLLFAHSKNPDQQAGIRLAFFLIINSYPPPGPFSMRGGCVYTNSEIV